VRVGTGFLHDEAGGMRIGFHRKTGGDFPADENMIVTEPAAVDAAVVRLPAIAAGDRAF
jgi:hypothetical protein